MNPVLAACLNKFGQGCGSVGIRLAEPDSEIVNGSIIPPEEFTPDQAILAALLQRPNPQQGYASFIMLEVLQYHLAGAAFVQGFNVLAKPFLGGTRIPVTMALRLRRPDYVRLTLGKWDVTGYEYNDGKGSKEIISPEEMLYIRAEHPTGELTPHSPLESAAYAIDTSNLGQRWNKTLLQRSGMPSAIARITGSKYSKEQERDKVRTEIERQVSGTQNIGRVAVVNADTLDLQMMGFSPKDMDWVSGDLTMLRRICAVMNVPSILVGDMGASTFANAAAADEWFYVNAVLPHMKQFASELQWKLRQWMRDDSITLTLDTRDIPALQENSADVAKEIALSDWLTVNEARERQGLQPLERPIGELTYIEIATAALRPPVDEPVEEAPEPEPPAEEPPMEDEERMQRRADPVFHPRSMYPTLELRAAEVKRREAKRVKWERKMRSTLAEYWSGQQERIMERLARKGYMATRAVSAADLLNDEEEAEVFVDLFETLFREMLAGMALAAVENLGQSLLIDQSRPLFTTFLTKDLAKRSRLINEATAEQINRVINEAQGGELSVKEAIQDYFNVNEKGGITAARAEAIARTEVGRADTLATKEGYAQFTEATGKTLRMEWITARDGGERHPSYEGLDGQVRPLDGEFDLEGIPSPGPGLSGVASEDINCRCVTAGLLDDMEAV